MKFKIFVCTSLAIIILLQGAIVGLLIYGGLRVGKAASSAKSSVNSQISNFTDKTNANLDQVNKNLTKISQELQKSSSSYNIVP